jgi:hypothetical protein
MGKVLTTVQLGRIREPFGWWQLRLLDQYKGVIPVDGKDVISENSTQDMLL